MCRYMKYTSLYIMKFVARDSSINIHSNVYDLRVSVTGSGLPRILPTYMRRGIASRELWVIKWVLTICNLYRVFPYPGKVKLSTITDPWLGRIDKGYLSYIPIFFSLLDYKPFTFFWKPFVLSAKGAFSSNLISDKLDKKSKKIMKRWTSGNSFSGFLTSVIYLSGNAQLWESVRWFFLRVSPSPSLTSTWYTLDRLVSGLRFLPNNRYSFWSKGVCGGKLAYKDEPGKVRVFAMVDCLTQWVLNPLHVWLFDLLRYIGNKYGTDATFDQDKAVEHLSFLMKTHKLAFSFDLSAATDRLPLILQIKLLNFVAPCLGDHWANLLVNRDYSVPSREGFSLPSSVRYACGQPMGALSSWAMLALTHHFIIQYAAYKVYHRKIWFKLYLVLGDDVVILDKRVASEYLRLMTQLAVGVNLSKSLVSPIGFAEFAKRLIGPDGLYSGVSLKEFSSLYSSWAAVLEIVSKTKVSLTNYLRLLGYGPLSAGNIVRSWHPNWNLKRWFMESHEVMSVHLRYYFRGLHHYLAYLGRSILSDYRIKLESRLKQLRHLDPSLLSSQLTSHLMVTRLRVPTTDEHVGLRLMAHRWFDEIMLPFSLDWVPRGRSSKSGERHLSVVNRNDLVDMVESIEKLVFELFVDSPLWSHLVWGRREDYMKLAKEWLGLYYPSNAGHYNTEDLIQGVVTNPDDWLDDPNTLAPSDIYLTHILATIPSEGMRMARVREMRDFSFIIELKSRAWSLWTKRFETLRLADPNAKPIKVVKPKSPPIKSISGLQFETKDGHYFHPFLGKWIAIDSIVRK